MPSVPLLQGNSQPPCCGPLLVTNGLKLQDGIRLSGGPSALLNPRPSNYFRDVIPTLEICRDNTGHLYSERMGTVKTRFYIV